MKIRRVASSLYPDKVGGIGGHIHEMSKEQVRRGYEVVVDLIERSKTRRGSERFRFVMLIIRTITLFNPLKVFLPISAILFGLGFFYLLYNIIFNLNVPDGAILLIISGILIFIFGVLADQMSSLMRGMK